MKVVIGISMAVSLSVLCPAQPASQDISPAQLQTVINLPLSQAVQQRETYKSRFKSAYNRQIASIGTDCKAESKEGQQPYNVCIGNADQQADKDFAIFYRSLQMLCHTLAELTALQSVHKAWLTYEESAVQAAHAAWPDGTGAPGFAAQVYLSLVRGHMRELHEIYRLNIAQ
jgi:uncharacterized protein YecT (DUF1311 family)